MTINLKLSYKVKMIYSLIEKINKGWNRIFVSEIKKRELGSCGKKIYISRGTKLYGAQNIFLGTSVSLGENNLLMSTRAKIKMGNHIMTGPNVCIITGNHRTDLVGRYMNTVGNEEKLPENDKDVIIEGDNWIGAGAMILSGVKVGFGSIVGGGAVVTKDIPPYAIVGGVPAVVIGYRFNQEEIIEHEKLLNIFDE